ncbi:hypothetical protein [Streptomyces sp. NPDC006739]|uniref:hypothetical protein n=1 Tax=Streptomyces sp. NPDC006739 TaxID=3364763 RepID=UPI0036992859
MLRILDARTGQPVDAAPARRGLTRVEAHAHGLDLTALRVLLTADLLVRALELGGTPVWTILGAPRHQAELRTAATSLAVRPFEDARDLASGLGEAQVVHVMAEGASLDVAGDGVAVGVAPVEWAPDHPRAGAARTAGRSGEPGEPGPGAGGAVAEHGVLLALSDPAALRLALLSVPRGTPVRLDTGVLGEAGRRLDGWRRDVAGWARQPSRPVPEPVRARLRAACEDDLDAPGVLAALRSVATAPDLSDGARFETYAYADRLLALDLTRDIGSLT